MSTPSLPYVVSLQAENPAELFRSGTNLTLIVQGQMRIGDRYGFESSRFLAGISIPPGIRILSGEPSYEGPIRDRLVVQITVRAESGPGLYDFRGWTEVPMNPVGGRLSPSVRLGVEGGPGNASQFSLPILPPWFGLEFDGDPQDPHRMRATATGRINATARLHVDLPSWLTLEAGNASWEGVLGPDRPVVLNVTVGFPSAWPNCAPNQTCEYPISAYLVPHPSVDGFRYKGTTILRVLNGAVSSIEPWRDNDGPQGG